MGSLCLGGYGYLFFLFPGLASLPLAEHLPRSGTVATCQRMPASFELLVK